MMKPMAVSRTVVLVVFMVMTCALAAINPTDLLAVVKDVGMVVMAIYRY